MKIWVSSLALVHDVAAKAQPRNIVSLLSPGDDFPVIDRIGSENHHKVHLHDIREPLADHVTPSGEHVALLIRFLKNWEPDSPLLVHCWAGISRSTATALIAACLHNPDVQEESIARVLSQSSPTAFPNTRMAALADDLMGRGGRLADAALSICADVDRARRVATTAEASPFSIPARYDQKAA